LGLRQGAQRRRVAIAKRFFPWRRLLVDARARVGIGAVREQRGDRRRIAARGGVMDRRIFVDPALLDVGAELE
jgi:hypothetical protein